MLHIAQMNSHCSQEQFASLSMLQTAQLKAAAEKEMKAVSKAISSQTLAHSSSDAALASNEIEKLRSRLERAIQLMQQGLVERDTEVD